MMYSYVPICNHYTKNNFLDYVHNLNLTKINFVAIEIEDFKDKKTVSLMSSDKWQQKFDINNYVNYDPLRKLILKTNRNLIILDDIDHIDQIGSEVMLQRKKCGILNGIVIVERRKECNYVLTIGTNDKSFNSYDYLIQNYTQIYQIMKDLKKIIYYDEKSLLS